MHFFAFYGFAMADKAIEFWRSLDLPAVQKDLDRDAEEIGKRREESEQSRKELVEASQAFRTSASEDVRKKVAGLIKRFQQEVDTLTKRGKGAEAAFLAVYQKLAVAPDPMPLIDAAIVAQTRMAASKELELTNQRLMHTIEEYRTEFADLKNQDVTIARLKDELKKYEDKMEDSVQQRVREKERQLLRSFADKERALQDQQLAMATKLGEAEQIAATLRAALDATQSELFDVRAHHDDEAAARAAALEVLERDAEAAQQRAEALRKELEYERERYQAALSEAQRGTGPKIDELSLAALERELQVKDRELGHLVDDHRALQTQFSTFKQSADARIAALDVVVKERTQALEALQRQAAAQGDYEDLKRELALLRDAEFGSESKEDRPLELLLREKLRTVTSEAVGLREQAQAATARLQDTEATLQKTQTTVAEQQQLITMLEAAIANVKAVKGTDPVAEDLLTGGNVAALSDTILPIVASQRDRFKTRNIELEAESRHQQQTIASLRNEIDTLRSDNVKLFEKIKFLQGYQPSAIAIDGEDVVRKYGPEYEEHINPFRAFNAKEKQRRYQGLNPAERIMLSISRTILAHPWGRIFTLAYLVFMHALIFLVLYKYSHVEACKRDLARQCLSQFAGHMSAVHHEHVLPDGLE
eukprot:m.107027 g.107027  ORF g.107027 m.107027 type:complete len:649 (+) comp8964_c0_seq1:1835-3781(+)